MIVVEFILSTVAVWMITRVLSALFFSEPSPFVTLTCGLMATTIAALVGGLIGLASPLVVVMAGVFYASSAAGHALSRGEN